MGIRPTWRPVGGVSGDAGPARFEDPPAEKIGEGNQIEVVQVGRHPDVAIRL